MESTFDKNLIIFLLLGTMVVIVLVAAIIFFVFKYHNKILLQEKALHEEKILHQQQLIQASLQAEEREKERLSKNVHDEMGTYSSLLRMNLSRFSLIPEKDEQIQKLLDEQHELITSMTSFVRNISMELSSPTVRDFGLNAGIEELIAAIEKNSDIHFTFNYTPSEQRFELGTEIQLLRIVKELLNNLIKHAQPNEIVLDCYVVKHNISISLTHDGKGITEEEFENLRKSASGIGLKSIDARVHSMHGKLVHKKTNSHYLIQLEIPLSHGTKN